MLTGRDVAFRGEVTNDARLAEGVARLESGTFEVLSLDVFDTLVWRGVPEPVDAFVLLGRRLLDGGELRSHVSPQMFAHLRERAEWRARQKVRQTGRVPEVGLDEIYRQMPHHPFAEGVHEGLPELEVELERTIIFPDLDVLSLARWASQDLGLRLVLVSDTYFSEARIRRLLDREPLHQLEVERIFTSSDFGAGKGSGLFRSVVEELDARPSAILHVGDNAEADVEHPRRLGVGTIFFDKYPGTFKEVLQGERLCRGDRGQEVKPTLDPVSGDFGLTALRAKAVSRVSGSERGPSVDGYWRFGTTVLGPAFTAYAEWVHTRASDEGIGTVYCMMREGEFLTRLVNGAAGYLRSPVRARPIWLSRQVCARAAIHDASAEELNRFLDRRLPPTVGQFCTSVGVSIDDVGDMSASPDASMEDPELAAHVLQHLSGNPQARERVLAGAARLRARLLRYVVATTGQVDGPVMLVDLGWGGTIQTQLNRALALGGAGLRTVGLYLLTNEGVLERTLDGVRAEGFLASAGLPPEAQPILRSPEILEQVCMHDQGSLIDFDDEAAPVLGPPDFGAAQTLQRTAVQAGILGFQQEWGRYRPVVPAHTRILDVGARPQLSRMLSRFIVSPTSEETDLFAGWVHDQGFGSAESETMVEPVAAVALTHMTPRHLLETPMTKAYWTFAMAAMYSPPLAQSAAAVADGRVPIEAFDPVRPCRVRVLFDQGQGLIDAVHPDAGPNTNGLCYLRAEVGGRPIRRVVLQVDDGPALLRVDWIRLVFSLQGRTDPVVVRIGDAGPLPRRMLRTGVVLPGNVLLSPVRPPKVVYLCPPEWRDTVYKFEVEMAFGWLPFPRPSGPLATSAVQAVRVAKGIRRRARGLRASRGL